MTSTKFNIGLGDESRSSSRVLRPPGGGHTDIFGAEPLPVKKDSGRNASSIMEGTNVQNQASPVKANAPAAERSATAQSQPAEQAPNTRGGRVPPGGFSSGLW